MRKSLKTTLMERDELTENEAQNLINEIFDEMMERISEGDFTEAEEIFSSQTGLEPDYIEDLLL